MPTKTSYWAEELQAKFNEIRKSEKEPKQALRDWGSRPDERKRAPKKEGVEGEMTEDELIEMLESMR